MRGEPGLFNRDERLKRLEGLGDPLLGFWCCGFGKRRNPWDARGQVVVQNRS
jgi:hypothetical protein